MKIRITKPVANARGSFKAGDEVDWPAKDAQPLIDTGCAEVAKQIKVVKKKESEA